MDYEAIPKILNRADVRLHEINTKLARKNGPHASSRNIALPDAVPVSHRELPVDESRNIWLVLHPDNAKCSLRSIVPDSFPSVHIYFTRVLICRDRTGRAINRFRTSPVKQSVSHLLDLNEEVDQKLFNGSHQLFVG